MGTRRWSEVRQERTPEVQAHIDTLKAADAVAGRVGQLRALSETGLTQVQVAAKMGIGQGNVSELERRTDVLVSTLRSYVEALGGVLEIRAIFEGHRVVLDLDPAIEQPQRKAAAD